MAENLVVIDGNSLLHRAFYALPPMKRQDGTPTNAVYGFFTMLLSIVEQYQPSYLAVAFDKKGKTFRHAFFEDYKAGRKKTPDDLISQFPLLKDALKGLKISVLEQDSYEADDILGALAAQARDGQVHAYLLTGDKDALQLISPNATVLLTKKGVSDLAVFDEAHLKEVYGLRPEQIPDLKGLMGDSSDNIPGVPGVGEKTALKLLGQFVTVEALYDHLEELPKNKLYEKLVANRDLAFLSKKLATIDTQMPLDKEISDLTFPGWQPQTLGKVLSDLDFHSLAKRMNVLEEPSKTVETVTIEKIEDLEALVRQIEEQPLFALVSGEDAISVAWETSKEYQIPLQFSLLGEGIAPAQAWQALAPVLQAPVPEKILHDAKSLKHVCREQGIELNGIVFDAFLAAYVVNPTRRNFSLEKLAQQYRAQGQAAALLDVAKCQKQEMREAKLERIFYDIEMPLLEVLYQMEVEGFAVNLGELERLEAEYGQSIEELTQEIYQLAGNDHFNIASTKQLGVVLFEELGLPALKKTKTGYSTDIEVLEKLADQHPIIPKLIEYRQLTKLKSTYLDGLLQAAKGAEHKVHTTFHQTATATGRISSSEPNLQNIPVRSPLSQEIRRAFIPSKVENYIVAADYSQIELRVLAHMADDSNMKDAFLKEQDIHTRTASEVFGVPLSMVTSQMRSSAKAVNFGIVYGISDFGLARNLGIPKYRAAEYIQKYLEEFSGVRQYMKDIVEEAKEKGAVRTLWGRIRYIDELRSSNYNTRSFGERAALNTPIQGTAADIIKAAMNAVYQALKDRKMRSKLILQVHDELIVDTVPDELEAVKSLLKETMENACQLSVPLKVNVAWGRNWAEAK